MRRSRLPILGHGPIFRDLNFEFDRDAAIAVLSAGLPITLIPYDAARNMQWTHADIERMQQSGGTAAWGWAAGTGWPGALREGQGGGGIFSFQSPAGARR